ncbi:gamma-glutamylcyclotransferase [Devosia chinhatensis]|uniref:glutathione-specific gamma-glutamylcyclotransferase n=1 Tax=Devosia chinhatensis TaxID=429727 RepID=A0A0F5FFQ3_9HYPH|nr:gamma-glutamylcyclotransferase [Devosia chinhatensis]KKB07681.1 gamma-glutamyl cyclotransferase [Devosia chinhatensis]
MQSDANDSFWVFGYGSLIWNPGFEFVGAQPGLLHGAHRALSIISHHYRGTPERPGLVFGLVRGGSCRGIAFEIAPKNWAATRAYLHAREMVTSVYRDAMRPVSLADGRRVSALAYLVDERHEQFAGLLSVDQQVEMVRTAHGSAGPNIDYVINTARHLEQLGIRDRSLMTLVRAIVGPDQAA